MKKILGRSVLLCTLFLIIISPLSSQESKFSIIPRKGSHAIGVNLNVAIPLFAAPLGQGEFYSDLGIYPGGLGSIIYQYFIMDALSIGAELKYDFLPDKNYRLNLINPDDNRGYILHMVPVTFKVIQYFDIIRQFSLAIEGNAGFSFVSYGESIEGVENRTFEFIPVLGAGLGAYWNINRKWSFGVTVNWWSYFEYGSDPYSLNTLDVGLRFNLLIQ